MMTLTTCCLHQWGMLNANRCPAQPRGDLLAQRNPTCDIRAYAGGLQVRRLSRRPRAPLWRW